MDKEFMWGKKMQNGRWRVIDSAYDYQCPCGKHKARIILHKARWQLHMDKPLDKLTIEGSIQCRGIWKEKGCTAHYFIKDGRYVNAEKDNE